MRQATFCLYYIVKYAELTFLFLWTSLIISSALWFIDTITEQSNVNDKDTQCVIFAAITIVLVFFNLFYNNLLINMRFYTKMKCVTFGKCTFDALNFCFCYCFLVKPCRDRCFTPWTIGKWIIKGGLFAYMIVLVQQKRQEWEENFQIGAMDDIGTSRLDTYLIVYLLQHPIFIIARIPIFILYTILTCCCDKGEEVSDENEFRDSILSFKFIEYEMGVLNNFENHPVGRNEWEYNRRLSFVRQQSMRNMAPAQNPNQSVV